MEQFTYFCSVRIRTLYVCGNPDLFEYSVEYRKCLFESLSQEPPFDNANIKQSLGDLRFKPLSSDEQVAVLCRVELDVMHGDPSWQLLSVIHIHVVL